jgi:LytS/YehU family sensor histidine kinase
LHQVRAGDSLQVTIDINETSLMYYLPPLTLQVLVENAIKHNIINEENPLNIVIDTPDEQKLIVKNNLNPKESIDSTNTGLSNIKARYNLLNSNGILIEKDQNEFKVTVPLFENSE